METIRDFDFCVLVEKSDGNLALMPKYQLMGAAFVELNAQLTRLQGKLGAPRSGTGPYVHHTSIATLKSVGSFVRANAQQFGLKMIAPLLTVTPQNASVEDMMALVAVNTIPLLPALRYVGDKIGAPAAYIPNVPYLPNLPTTSAALSAALKQKQEEKQGSGSMMMLALIGITFLVAIGSDGLKPKGRK